MENQPDVIASADVHFCFISAQAAVNFFPAVTYRPQEAVLFITREMAGNGTVKALKSALTKAVPGIVISEAALADAYDLTGIRETVAAEIEKRRDRKVVINITGGTKIMAIGAMLAGSAAHTPCFYLNESDNRVSLIDPNSNEQAAIRQGRPIEMKLENYLAAYGFTLESSTPFAPLSEDEDRLIYSLIRSRSFKDSMPRINQLATTREACDNLEAPISGTYIPKRQREAFDELCATFEDAGRLSVRNDIVTFKSEEDRFFVAGGWLERYVCSELEHMGLNPMSNIVVSSAACNEIDVGFMHNGTFYIVECKTSNMSMGRIANPVIYKLESLKKFGGLRTRLILVSYRMLYDESYKRAVDQKTGITLIEGENLKNLRTIVEKCLHSKTPYIVMPRKQH